MDQRKRLDLEVASEFVTMAAHLVFIKTRMLLSIHDEMCIRDRAQADRRRHPGADSGLYP